jgi:REP element-mobilizing transposase RayT
VAELVANALRFFDGQRYQLFAWCIMPNHVHVIFRPFADWTLPKLLHSWKSYTSKEANRILGRSGRFWQDEYYDHLVRNENDFERQVRYAVENQTKSGLSNWRWLGLAPRLLQCLFPPGTAPDQGLGQDGQATSRGTGVPPVTGVWQKSSPIARA